LSREERADDRNKGTLDSKIEEGRQDARFPRVVFEDSYQKQKLLEFVHLDNLRLEDFDGPK